MGDLRTPRGLRIPEEAVRYSFTRASGAGGQHVNTSATRVQVRIVLEACQLDASRLATLLDRYGPEVRATDASSRSQWRNRATALARALELIDGGLARERPRVATRATRSSKERRLADKARHSRRKAERRRPNDD